MIQTGFNAEGKGGGEGEERPMQLADILPNIFLLSRLYFVFSSLVLILFWHAVLQWQRRKHVLVVEPLSDELSPGEMGRSEYRADQTQRVTA